MSRELNVAVIAGCTLVFTGWAWGGVVLWTQFATCGLGALALLVALTPRDPDSPYMVGVRRSWMHSLILGALVAAVFAGLDIRRLLEQRASTLELVPDTTLAPIAFRDWGLRGLGIGVAVAVAGLFLTAFRTPTHTRSALLRFPPFWIGLALFIYIAVQSLNPWGIVVERDTYWKTLPLEHISWLPAGLDAPFVGDSDPGGMNGWRQMLILSGPWMLLCAMHIAVIHQRTLVRLAWVVGLNSLAVGVVGAVVASGNDFSFLGFENWFAHKAPFGPFIYKNHAGIYLYLSAALALALTARLIVRKGDRADRGGPHLLSGLLVVMLCLCAVSTLSVGALIGAGMMLIVAPLLYFTDPKIRMALSVVPALMMVTCGTIIVYFAMASADLNALRQRIEQKQADIARTGADDRTPIRRATIAQIEDGGVQRVVFGWGAGSYRWTSPVYFAQQPEFVDTKGRLWARANFAHCDWLQALLEWGIVGGTLLLIGLGWLLVKVRNAWRRRSASLLALSTGLVVVLVHASFDFTFYFTPALTLLALMLAWLTSAEAAEAPRLGY